VLLLLLLLLLLMISAVGIRLWRAVHPWGCLPRVTRVPTVVWWRRHPAWTTLHRGVAFGLGTVAHSAHHARGKVVVVALLVRANPVAYMHCNI
jgi:hypothetical protein